ncbi:MerR family transcriptional regulator (plasmid) [Rossellomorea sp. AcN35-11]|nr:helix-turn-helix domain-containing protein [Rossellomorea aquimaris]WJV32249.1 MerR family transcriptional regulator [Rossellomorea sp. AcN35-11]
MSETETVKGSVQPGSNLVGEETEISNVKKEYTITDLADMFGKSPATIRNWEKAMGDLLNVERNGYNARVYSEKSMRIFAEINHWRDQGFSIEVIYKLLASSKKLYEQGQNDNGPFSEPPKFGHDMLVEFEKVLKEQLNNQMLLLGDGRDDEEKRKQEKEEHVSRESARRRVDAKLKAQALKEWAKEPEGRRLVKSGFFSKEENINERDAFVEEYIGEHFEHEYRKEILGE